MAIRTPNAMNTPKMVKGMVEGFEILLTCFLGVRYSPRTKIAGGIARARMAARTGAIRSRTYRQ
jgi:hypothetical protein